MSADAIEVFLIERVAELLGIDVSEVDPARPHASYGLDSATALLLAGDIEDELGVRLSDSVAWDYPTLRSLAAHIAAVRDGGEG
ncbi:MAG: acyl carrier protein [Myxococcales bacterium]|nr:acyl carrier protein [Myxococcales bacterium]